MCRCHPLTASCLAVTLLALPLAAGSPARTSPAARDSAAAAPGATTTGAPRQQPAGVSAEEEGRIRAAMPAHPIVPPSQPRRLLVFNRSEGFHHDSIPVASRTFEIMGEITGAFTTVPRDDMAVFSPVELAPFDGILLNNTTRLTFPEEDQRRALLDFVRSGGGLIGIHAATDSFYEWPDGAALIGGLFDDHPWTAGGTWAVKLDEPNHPLNRPFHGQGFLIRDEIYQLKDPYSRQALRVLLSLDMRDRRNLQVDRQRIHRRDGDFAISWIRPYSRGRVFYCSLGHNREVYWNPAVLGHYLAGIQFALGDLSAPAEPAEAPGPIDTPVPGESWRPLDQGDWSGFREPHGSWALAREARVHADDERRLEWTPPSTPGEPVVLVNGPQGRTVNLLTRREHGDVQLHIEFMVPRGSNSGVYFMGRYEIQVLDSWGVRQPAFSDCGGIYQRWDPSRQGDKGYEGRSPRVNACRPPGRWQSYDVIFRAPRFDAAGAKVANARFVKVIHNGVLIHENQEVSGPTRAATFADEQPLGPLMLQGDHGPVAYRAIVITPLASD